MLEWLKKDGGYFEKIKLRYHSNGERSVIASRDIKQGETVLLVPLKNLLTLEMTYESPMGKLLVACNMKERLVN